MPDFNKYSLHGSEALLNELERRAGEIQAIAEILAARAGIETSLLKRLAVVVNNQAFNIFLYVLEYGPVNRKQLNKVFPTSTLKRIIPMLEAAEVIVYRNHRYMVKRMEPTQTR